jgi:glutathione S-transferase
MITLYHAPRSRSTRMIWLLEELGASYEIVQVGIKRPTGVGAADPKNPHPDGRVPALVHDGQLVTESVAIALYLTDLFPEKGIGRRVDDAKRGEYLTWLAYYALMEGALTARETNPQEAEKIDRRVVQALSRGPYLLGDRFSAADLFLTSLLQFARRALPEAKVIDEFLARVSARPALARATAKDGTP